MDNADFNKQVIQRFCDSADAKQLRQLLGGTMNIVKTERINSQGAVDAYTTSCYSKERGIGVTAIAFGLGQFKAYVEVVGDTHVNEALPEAAGAVLLGALLSYTKG